MIIQKILNKIFPRPSKPATYGDVVRFLNAIPNINNGGCFLAAYSVYLWLKKQGQLPTTFRVALMSTSDNKDSFMSNTTYFKKNDGTPSPVSHCGWSFRGMNIQDTNEKVHWEDSYPNILMIEGTELMVYHLLTKKQRWNPTFDRAKWLPRIEKHLGINLC